MRPRLKPLPQPVSAENERGHDNAVARCGSRRLANCSGVGNGGPIPSEDSFQAAMNESPPSPSKALPGIWRQGGVDDWAVAPA